MVHNFKHEHSLIEKHHVEYKIDASKHNQSLLLPPQAWNKINKTTILVIHSITTKKV
jgi:hypothetical protein